MSRAYCLPQGSSADGPYDLLVTPKAAGWGYSGLRILTLAPGETHALSTGECEFRGYQRVYGTPGRPVDVLAEVRSGDTVLIPHGWHGPSIAAPGWVRETWASQDVDDRLPFGEDR